MSSYDMGPNYPQIDELNVNGDIDEVSIYYLHRPDDHYDMNTAGEVDLTQVMNLGTRLYTLPNRDRDERFILQFKFQGEPVGFPYQVNDDTGLNYLIGLAHGSIANDKTGTDPGLYRVKLKERSES